MSDIFHEYFEYEEGGEVIPIFERIRVAEVPSKEEFTDELHKDVMTLVKNLNVAPTEDLHELHNLLDIRIGEIQKKRQATDYSNFMHFQFNMIRSKIKQEIKLRKKGVKFKSLKSSEIIEYLVEDESKNESTEFADTINQFINLAPKDTIRMGIPKILQGEQKFPILFYTNPKAIEKIMEYGKVHVITGHCIIGFDSNQDKDEQITECLNKGIALQDLLIYKNLKDMLGTLESKLEMDGITINVDTFYYKLKLGDTLKKCKKYEVDETEKILEDLLENHAKTIKKVLPNAVLRASGSKEYLAELMEIVDNGLLDYIINEIGEYMGHDLTVERDMAKALAVTSATYMFPILKRNIPTVAIESSLNTENPAGICQRYLDKIGKGDMFSFVGVFPLANTKMSHASMYYGNSSSKIFIGDTREEITEKVLGSSMNHENPNNCFIVNYHLSSGKPLPKDCHHKLCGLHYPVVIKQIMDVIDEYK